MAVDYFFKIEGVKGETKDTKHPGEIDVLSWSWGITQTGTMAYAGGGGGGKANVSDFSFMKRLDAATSRLKDSIQKGEHFNTTSSASGTCSCLPGRSPEAVKSRWNRFRSILGNTSRNMPRRRRTALFCLTSSSNTISKRTSRVSRWPAKAISRGPRQRQDKSIMPPLR
jgi:hypothetical protein